MPVRSKCLHRAIAESYKSACIEDPSFHSFLLDILPNLDIERCSLCSPNCPSCDGEYLEFHPDPDSFIFGLESVRNGSYEDPFYGPTGMSNTRNSRVNCGTSRGVSLDLRNAVPIDPALLSGDVRFDRSEVYSAINGQSEDSSLGYRSLQDEIDDGLRDAS